MSSESPLQVILRFAARRRPQPAQQAWLYHEAVIGGPLNRFLGYFLCFYLNFFDFLQPLI